MLINKISAYLSQNIIVYLKRLTKAGSLTIFFLSLSIISPSMKE